jgi:hypothetical protein
MAINFLNTVDFKQNQLDNAAIQNLTGDPGSGVEGQIYFNTVVKALKIYDGGNWVEVGATSGVETLSSDDGTASTGKAITFNNQSIGDVVVNVFEYNGGSNVGYVPAGGTVGKYLDGAGNWLDVTTGDITAVLQGTYINIDNQTGPTPTVNHNLTSRTDTTSASSPGSAGTFTTVDSVTTNSTGHVSALNLKTITLPTSDNYSSWTLDGDTGTPQTILSGDTATFTGGTKISTAVAATDVLTITHDATTRTNTTSAVTANTFTVLDSVGSDSTGHVTGSNLKTVTTSDTLYDLLTTNGDNPDLVLDPNSGSDDIVNMDGTGSTVKVTGSGTNTLKFDLVDNVTIVGDLTVSGGDITLGSTGRIQGVDTVQDPTDAASKSYVDQSNIGQSVFQGGYNAATNTPDLDVSPASSIKKGFFWAVTDTGDFFTEEVQPGDLIYADQDNPGATFANWVVVQSGQDIATAGATDGATVKGIAGFNSAHFNVTSNGWVSSDIYSGGSTLGIVPSGGTSTTFLRGDGSFEVPDYVTYGIMSTTTLGLAKLRYSTGTTPAANARTTTAGRTYGVTKNSSNQLIVNVPWVDTNTQNVTSVNAAADADLLGIEVSPTTGVVKVGLDINGLAAISTLADADTLPIYDGGTNKKISLLQLENHIGAAKSKRFVLNTTTDDVTQQVSPPGGTIGWVVDAGTALGVTTALDCMVEIIETSNGATVYAEVTRSGTNVTINFSTPVSQGAYQALITRIY